MLVKKQKKIIEKYYKNGVLAEIKNGDYGNYNEMFRECENIKDTETLPQDIRHYLENLDYIGGLENE